MSAHAPGKTIPPIAETVFSVRIFLLPAIVAALFVAGVSGFTSALTLAIAIGLSKIIVDSISQIRAGRYSLDYIACCAMVVALATGAYIPGAVIALMFTGGEALEAFASDRAERTLRALADRIPKTCLVRVGDSFQEIAVQQVRDGSIIVLKRNELVPLDGVLVSAAAVFDLSSLTGEAEPIEMVRDGFVKSGSVNVGDTLELRVAGDFTTSTYHRIVGLVDEARKKPAHFVRFSEQVNLPFTLAAFTLAIGAYLWSGEVSRALAVLVIATPCPLIIAAPVAFIGGLSRAARDSIIVRTPSALEKLARVDTVFFDKTGTLTLGEPALTRIEVLDGAVRSEEEALAIVAAIEIHSLHPLARAIVKEARRRNVRFAPAEKVSEELGVGVSGVVESVRYTVGRAPRTAGHSGIVLLVARGEKEVARVHFSDVMKGNASSLFASMRKRGIEVGIITGDRRENAEALFGTQHVSIHAETSPEDKFKIITDAKAAGKVVAMVGDGLNDAPALAQADVGIVFSGAENTATVEAASIAVLDSGLNRVPEILSIARQSMRVARQSVYGGIALSLVGMVGAASGMIAPLPGALLQEGIDVLVILNALRTLR